MRPSCANLVRRGPRLLADRGSLRRRVRGAPRRRSSASATPTSCNSGSSANLLAVSALTSPSLGDRRLRPGDEVITVAAGFPTTVNPIVQTAWCRCSSTSSSAPTTRDVEPHRGRDRAAHARDRAGAHARQPVRPRRRHATRRASTTSGSSRTAATRSARRYDGRLIGTFGDLATAELLPRAPHHDGRGRLRAHRPAARSSKIVESLPRLGPRLLVRAGRGEHVRQALRLAARRPARAATTTSTSTRTSATT